MKTNPENIMNALKKHSILAATLLVSSLSGFAEKDSAVTSVMIDELVNPYLEVQSSLAGDNLAAANAGAETLLSTIEARPRAESLDPLRNAAESLARSDNVKAARSAFLDLSNEMIGLVTSEGFSEETSLYVAHCPMAFAGEGGSWLQADSNVLNPYYGASMLRCGSISEKIGHN